jgi:hypothetical protein
MYEDAVPNKISPDLESLNGAPADSSAEPELTAEMVFSTLDPIKVPVRIDGKPYVIREASEAVAVRYKDLCMAAARMNDGKVSGVVGLAESEPVLVQGCLFELLPLRGDPSDLVERPVSMAFVRALPHKVVKPLFERAQKISDLEERDTVETLRKKIKRDTERLNKLLESRAEAEEDSSKNSPGSTGPTSATRPSADSRSAG